MPLWMPHKFNYKTVFVFCFMVKFSFPRKISWGSKAELTHVLIYIRKVADILSFGGIQYVDQNVKLCRLSFAQNELLQDSVGSKR